jgi:hypothetical protein
VAKTKGKVPAKASSAKSSTRSTKSAAKPGKSSKSSPVARSTPTPPATARAAIAMPTARPSAPTIPPPPPAPPRDEMEAPKDVARLLRYGERFGPHKIDVRMLPLQLPVSSGALAVFDPAVPKSWRVFDRPVGSGQFRVMLSVAQKEGREQLAAVVIHVGRPPIAKWTVAHYRGKSKPRSPDQLPRVPVTSGYLALIDAAGDSPGELVVPPAAGIAPVEVPLTDGRRALALPCDEGEYAAYWAVDAADKPICLVVDFDAFTQKDWKARAT